MAKSEQIDKLAQALVRVQAVLEGAKKDNTANVGSYRYKYADLEGVWDVLREPLTANGLAIVQMPTTGADGSTVLETILMHESGQWIDGAMPLLLPKMDPQAQGSAITYARRYALCGATGVVQVDDDGKEATDRVREQAAQRGIQIAIESQQPSRPTPTVTPPQKNDAEQAINSMTNEWNVFKAKCYEQGCTKLWLEQQIVEVSKTEKEPKKIQEIIWGKLQHEEAAV